MLFMRQPKIRTFTYRPRFYTPAVIEEDEPRIKFRRLRSTSRPARRRSALIMVALIVILLYMLHYLNTLKDSEEASKERVFQVEEIIVK